MSHTNFSTLKKNRKSEFDRLASSIEKLNTEGGRQVDNRFWTPTVDKAGNGFAVIRFLPAPPGEDDPYVRIWSHAFKGPTGLWYVENSLRTLGQKDPVGELNRELWATEDKEKQEQVRKQKRRLSFISNIYVEQDSGNPANEGKVFLYRYGKKIWDKIEAAMYPQFEDETAINPFDFWEGASFKLKIRKVEGYQNYDKSEFASVAPLSNDDDVLEKIWKSEHPLQPFIAPDQFKSYDELKAHMYKVLALAGDETPAATRTAEAASKRWDQAETEARTRRPAVQPSAPPAASDEDEDDLEFRRLMGDDV